MKNTKKNKEKWIEKVRYTLELREKSNRTFGNYKSHITRFLIILMKILKSIN